MGRVIAFAACVVIAYIVLVRFFNAAEDDPDGKYG